MLNKTDILAILNDNRSLLAALGVLRLGLFGSFVRGNQHADSDVDLLVDFIPGAKSFDNFMATFELLENLLGRKIELVTTESLSPYIGPKILQEAEYVGIAA